MSKDKKTRTWTSSQWNLQVLVLLPEDLEILALLPQLPGRRLASATPSWPEGFELEDRWSTRKTNHLWVFETDLGDLWIKNLEAWSLKSKSCLWGWKLGVLCDGMWWLASPFNFTYVFLMSSWFKSQPDISGDAVVLALKHLPCVEIGTHIWPIWLAEALSFAPIPQGICQQMWPPEYETRTTRTRTTCTANQPPITPWLRARWGWCALHSLGTLDRWWDDQVEYEVIGHDGRTWISRRGPSTGTWVQQPVYIPYEAYR